MSGQTSRQIVLNGEAFETSAVTLAELVLEAGFGDGKVATAVNGTFIAAGRRTATGLKAGDRVEVLSARQGG